VSEGNAHGHDDTDCGYVAAYRSPCSAWRRAVILATRLPSISADLLHRYARARLLSVMVSRQATCSAGWVRGLPWDQVDHTIGALSRGVTSGDRPVRGRTAGFRDTARRAAHTAGIPVRLHHIVVDAHDLPGLARFWTQALGWSCPNERDRYRDRRERTLRHVIHAGHRRQDGQEPRAS